MQAIKLNQHTQLAARAKLQYYQIQFTILNLEYSLLQYQLNRVFKLSKLKILLAEECIQDTEALLAQLDWSSPERISTHEQQLNNLMSTSKLLNELIIQERNICAKQTKIQSKVQKLTKLCAKFDRLNEILPRCQLLHPDWRQLKPVLEEELNSPGCISQPCTVSCP